MSKSGTDLLVESLMMCDVNTRMKAVSKLLASVITIKIMERRLVLVYEGEEEKVNKMLSNGWEIVKMSASVTNLGMQKPSVCYLYMIKGK